jgi:hypothetical protein
LDSMDKKAALLALGKELTDLIKTSPKDDLHFILTDLSVLQNEVIRLMEHEPESGFDFH